MRLKARQWITGAFAGFRHVLKGLLGSEETSGCIWCNRTATAKLHSQEVEYPQLHYNKMATTDCSGCLKEQAVNPGGRSALRQRCRRKTHSLTTCSHNQFYSSTKGSLPIKFLLTGYVYDVYFFQLLIINRSYL